MSDPGALVVGAILVIPAASAVLLALLPDDRTTARLNVLGTFLTLLFAVALFFVRPEPGLFLIVDDVNVVFIVLNTFVRALPPACSAEVILRTSFETGRLTHVYLRFYHAMYQTLMFAMNLALLANNVGLMWVAVELATLTTVLMVGIIGLMRRSRRHGSISSWAASASRSRFSGRSSSISHPAR